MLARFAHDKICQELQGVYRVNIFNKERGIYTIHVPNHKKLESQDRVTYIICKNRVIRCRPYARDQKITPST